MSGPGKAMKDFNVLLVDDEKDFIVSLAQRLSLRQLHVRTAFSGYEALEVLAREPIDVVVLDVRMPGMNGIETLREIRKRHPGVEVIMLTGHADLEASLDGMHLGFFDYLTKPIDINHLVTKLQHAYEKKTSLTDPVPPSTFKEKMKEHLVAADRLASLGTLAAEIAHEINNPLAVITEASAWLRSRASKEPALPDSFKETLDKALTKTEAAVDRALRISRGLLNFARKTDAAAREIDLGDLALEVIELTRKTAANAQIEVRYEARTERTMVWIDPYQLRQVLLDIVTNALQAVSPGGWVRLILDGNLREAVLSVQDNGPGIPAENLERIFEPFFTTKPPGQGTGLGLAVSRGIMEKIGGRIEVETTVDQGSTFHLILPRTQAGLLCQPA
jgi:signal transduction histidine kinase